MMIGEDDEELMTRVNAMKRLGRFTRNRAIRRTENCIDGRKRFNEAHRKAIFARSA